MIAMQAAHLQSESLVSMVLVFGAHFIFHSMVEETFFIISG